MAAPSIPFDLPASDSSTSAPGYVLGKLTNSRKGEGSDHYRIPAQHFAFIYLLSGCLRMEGTATPASFPGPALLQVPQGNLLSWDPQKKLDATVVLVRHQFLVAELDAYRPGVRETIRESVFNEEPTEAAVAPLGVGDRIWVESVQRPPVQGIASQFWFRAKVQEMLALQAFPGGKPEQEFFCSRQRRLAGERVTKVKWLLGQHLDEPLDLKALAKEVGCSTHYLCRTFSAETGITISRYLRSVRMERAAALLRSGRFNVSEAAIEVGYNSMSHFSKAFQEEKGCPPSQYVAAA